MPRDVFDPEQQNVTLIAAVTLREAERLIQSCGQCHPDDADIHSIGFLTAFRAHGRA